MVPVIGRVWPARPHSTVAQDTGSCRRARPPLLHLTSVTRLPARGSWEGLPELSTPSLGDTGCAIRQPQPDPSTLPCAKAWREASIWATGLGQERTPTCPPLPGKPVGVLPSRHREAWQHVCSDEWASQPSEPAVAGPMSKPHAWSSGGADCGWPELSGGNPELSCWDTCRDSTWLWGPQHTTYGVSSAMLWPHLPQSNPWLWSHLCQRQTCPATRKPKEPVVSPPADL